MGDIDWKEKFPGLKRISGAPPLFMLNGCGLSIYGRRDYDKETNSYVKTYCLCIVFIPVLPLCAYRVVDAGGGRWYFIGREPLSLFAKSVNFALLLAVLFGCGMSAWEQHTHSREYIFSSNFASAQEKEAQGQSLAAARLYADVANSNTSHSAEAHVKLSAILAAKIPTEPVAEALGLLQLSSSLPPNERDPALAAASVRMAALQETDPAAALQLFDGLALLQKTKPDAATREAVLQKCVEKNPKDIPHASELALIFENRKEFDRCEKLLTPLQADLGSSEGARILGEIFAGKDQNEAAYKLLSPYAEARLASYHAAESNYTSMAQSVSDRALEQLRRGAAPPSFYTQYEHLSKDQQSAKVDEYISNAMKNDAALKQCEETLRKESVIVPVALDLGIVRLRRAQAMSGPERKPELEAAEKLFTAIRGAAGQNDQYRVFYGQVLYWLGKHDEGKKQFDDLLAAKGRTPENLQRVAGVYRAVGAHSEARAMLEEAYGKETDKEKKYEIAGSRACTFIDLEDEIKWLQLTNLNEVHNTATLNVTLGRQAARDGKKNLAADYYHKGLDGYASLPRSPATLNNGSLAAFALYNITHEGVEFNKGLEMLGAAYELEPSDTTLMHNYAEFLLADAVRATIGDAINFKALDTTPEREHLSALYNDRAGEQEFVKRIVAHPSYIKGITMLERLVVLAPRSPSVYNTLQEFHQATDNLAKLKQIKAQLAETTLDTEFEDRTLENMKGGKDDVGKQELATSQRRLETLLAGHPTDKRVIALLNADLADTLTKAEILGQASDFDRVVMLAEQSVASEPSHYTRWVLISALLTRAGKTLEKQEPAFRDFVAKYRRSLAMDSMLGFNAVKAGSLRDAIVKNPDVLRALSLLKEYGRTWPNHRSSFEWPLFNATDPEEAKSLAEIINNDMHRTHRSIKLIINPANTESAMGEYFSCLADGREADGRKALENCASHHAPIPTAP